MSSKDDPKLQARRSFLTRAAGVAAAAAGSVISPAHAHAPAVGEGVAHGRHPENDIESFWGSHQAGIATPQQRNVYFAAFDLTTSERADVIELMRSWTSAAARLTVGAPALPINPDPEAPPDDSGEAQGLAAHRLTITFGFGSGLFVKDGVDRFGLNQWRPEAFIDLPRFPGDQLVAQRTGGDLCVQACADDPQVAFHAVRQLARLGSKVAQIRWAQAGFLSIDKHQPSPRNLMGFKDGTMNVPTANAVQMSQHVWVGEEGGWMKDGSYLVARPIRIALEHWDRMKLAFQEQVVGRHKLSGAPLGKTREADPIDLDAVDGDGNPVIPENSHVRLAAPASNEGAQILRRGYSYDNGLSFIAERWPPWHQGMEFDAGLLFMCYQNDPRTGFVKIFEKLSRFDMMNQFVTPVGGGMFACPRGAAGGEYVGQHLLEHA